MSKLDGLKVYKRKRDSSFIVIARFGEYCTASILSDPSGWVSKEEVESYLQKHPEALVLEPAPPEPTQEELDAREVQTAKSYLALTDWIVAKIGEAQMKGIDIAPLLEKYAPDLQKREEARAAINELGK